MGYLYPNKTFKQKACRRCLTVFIPTNPCNVYCSTPCVEESKRSRYLERNYGITVDEYAAYLQEQDARCKICQGAGFTMAEHHNVKLVVDHCHTTGEVRGLLCHNCNRALGLLKDDTEVLTRAIDYLKGNK